MHTLGSSNFSVAVPDASSLMFSCVLDCNVTVCLALEFCAINFEVSSLQIFMELMELSLDDLLSAVGFVPGENI